MNVYLDCRGEGSSNMNASKEESVETGDESVETKDESIGTGEKHNNHIIMGNNIPHKTMGVITQLHVCPRLLNGALDI